MLQFLGLVQIQASDLHSVGRLNCKCSRVWSGIEMGRQRVRDCGVIDSASEFRDGISGREDRYGVSDTVNSLFLFIEISV